MSRTTLAYCALTALAFFAASPNTLAWDERHDCGKPPAGMVGWWPGNGNTNDVWAGHNGQLVGGATFGPGKVEKAFKLNGVSAYVNVPDTPSLNFGAGEFTVDLWVNFTNINGSQTLVEKWVDAPGGSAGFPYGWTFLLTADHRLFFAVEGRSEVMGGVQDPWGGVASDPLSLQANTWYHFAARRAVSGVSLFVNGKVVMSSTRLPNDVYVSSGSSLRFGRACRGGLVDEPDVCYDPPGGLFLNGRIDEVELFNRAVSDSEIRAIYRAGRAGKCEPMSGTVSGLKLDEVTCQAGGRWVTALITDSRFWNCTAAGLAPNRRDNVQVRIKGTVLGE